MHSLRGYALLPVSIAALSCLPPGPAPEFTAWKAQRARAMEGRAADSVCASYTLVRSVQSHPPYFVYRDPSGTECTVGPKSVFLGPVLINDHMVCPGPGTDADFRAERASVPENILNIEVIRDRAVLAKWPCARAASAVFHIRLKSPP